MEHKRLINHYSIIKTINKVLIKMVTKIIFINFRIIPCKEI